MFVVETLYTKAYSVDAIVSEKCDKFGSDVVRIKFNSKFVILIKTEMLLDAFEEFFETVNIEYGWCAATDIDTIKGLAAFVVFEQFYFFTNSTDVFATFFLIKDCGIEVAIDAALLAEWDVNVKQCV